MKRAIVLARYVLLLSGLVSGTAWAADEPSGVLPASSIPKDAQIIFDSDRAHETDAWGKTADALYVATLDGRVTRITHSKFAHNHFEVSPDRRYIIANRYSRGPKAGGKDVPSSSYFAMRDWKELWLIDTVTGRERRMLPNVDAIYGGVAWGSDSKTVYFATPSLTNTMRIVRVNIDTEKVDVLSENLNKLLGVPGDRQTTTDLDLSRDGTRLVFLYQGADRSLPPRIATMKVDGSEAHFVSDGGPLRGQRGVWSVGDFDPTISPDGTQMAWARVTDKGMVSPSLSTFDIIVANLDGSDVRDISDPNVVAADFIPAWEWNDEGKLIFTHFEPKASIMEPEIYDPKTGTHTLINIGGQGSYVQWIPSGKKN